MRTLASVGIRRVVVVCGYHAGEVAAHAGTVARRLALRLEIVIHPQWQRGNAGSVLAARKAVNGVFLLVMCDHLFDARILRLLLQENPPAGGLVLAVDGCLENPLVDMEDVTRVLRQGRHIEAIGKGLGRFDAFDTGAFLCSPGVFTALADTVEKGEGGLSNAVMSLAREGKAMTLDVSGSFWIDVDDADAMRRAERSLRSTATTASCPDI